MKNSQDLPFKNSSGLQSAFSTRPEQHNFGEDFFPFGHTTNDAKVLFWHLLYCIWTGREYLGAPTRLGTSCCWSWIQCGRKRVRKRHHQVTEGEEQNPPSPPGPAPPFKLFAWMWTRSKAQCRLQAPLQWLGRTGWGPSFQVSNFFGSFALFSLTVPSNNIILIKFISIYNFDCILMKVFLLVVWGFFCLVFLIYS